MILPMRNPLQEYSWGSKDYIQSLLALPDRIGTPIAEMWMGAHPKAPSRVETNGVLTPLDAFIASQQQQCLGDFTKLYNGKLPFLLKVLAADEPLSIQAHPSLEQARKGFLRENNLGIPIDSAVRNYRDDNHKPELICAITPFTALCGFRTHDQICANLLALGVDSLLTAFPQFQTVPNAHTWKLL